MPKRIVEYFIIDILLAIHGIKRTSANMKTVQSFERNYVAYNAIMHELEVIGEAMKYVLSSKELKPHLKAEWKKIVAFRNIVVHEYFGVSTDDVFSIIKDNLPLLEQDLIKLIRKINDKSNVKLAIASARLDFQKREWRSGVLYLTKLNTKLRLNK